MLVTCLVYFDSLLVTSVCLSTSDIYQQHKYFENRMSSLYSCLSFERATSALLVAFSRRTGFRRARVLAQRPIYLPLRICLYLAFDSHHLLLHFHIPFSAQKTLQRIQQEIKKTRFVSILRTPKNFTKKFFYGFWVFL